MSISSRYARDLSALGSRAGATVLGGQLLKEGERYIINKTDVTGLLESLVGQSVVVVVSSVNQDQADKAKTCITCGRDYTEIECPHCANVRSRLRGGDR